MRLPFGTFSLVMFGDLKKLPFRKENAFVASKFALKHARNNPKCRKKDSVPVDPELWFKIY